MKVGPLFSAVFLLVFLSFISFPSSSEEMESKVVFAENGDVIAIGGACAEEEEGESAGWVRSINVLRFVAGDGVGDLAESLYGARFSKGSDGALHFFAGGELSRPLILVPKGSPFQDVGFTSRFVNERYGLVEGTYDVIVSEFFSWGRQSSSRLGIDEAVDIAVDQLEGFPGVGSVDVDVGKISTQSAIGCNSGGPGAVSCSCGGSLWIVDDSCNVVCAGNRYACCLCTFMPGTSACRCVGSGGGPVGPGPGGPGGPGDGDDDDDDDDGGADEAQ